MIIDSIVVTTLLNASEFEDDTSEIPAVDSVEKCSCTDVLV